MTEAGAPPTSGVPLVNAPRRRWPLVPAAIIGVVAIAEIFRVAQIVPSALQPLFVPVVLIAVGAYLILAPRV